MQYTIKISITIRSFGRTPKKQKRVTAGRSTQYLNWNLITIMSTDLSLGKIILNKINTERNTDCISYTTQHLLWSDTVTANNSNTEQYSTYNITTESSFTVMHCNRCFLFTIILIRTKTCRVLSHNAFQVG